MDKPLHCGHLDPYAIHMTTSTSYPDLIAVRSVPTRPAPRPSLRTRWSAHRARVAALDARLARVDAEIGSRLDRLSGVSA